MSSIDLATRFKIGIYPLNRERRCSPRSADTKQVLNELPTAKRQIKVPEEWHTHVDNMKTCFRKILFKCVTRQDLSGDSSKEINYSLVRFHQNIQFLCWVRVQSLTFTCIDVIDMSDIFGNSIDSFTPKIWFLKQFITTMATAISLDPGLISRHIYCVWLTIQQNMN